MLNMFIYFFELESEHIELDPSEDSSLDPLPELDSDVRIFWDENCSPLTLLAGEMIGPPTLSMDGYGVYFC